MGSVPEPGHWRRDDGSGSLEVSAAVSKFPTFDQVVDEVFEDEQPLASTTSVAEPTEEEKIAQLLNVPVYQIHRLDWTPEEAKELLADMKDKAVEPVVVQGPSSVAEAFKLLEETEKAAQDETGKVDDA